jgi:hypothetical protein
MPEFGNQEEEQTQQPAIIDLTEEDQAARQIESDDFIRKAILLPNPQMEHDNRSILPTTISNVAAANKSTLPTTSSHVATVNKALALALGKRPSRKTGSQLTNLASVNTPSAKALEKRPAESSIDEDQYPKRQRLDTQPTPSFPVINTEEYKQIVTRKAQDLFETQIPHLRSQYSNNNIQEEINMGLQSRLLNECMQMAKEHVMGMYQQGRQKEIMEADLHIQQTLQARQIMAAQHHQQHIQQQQMQQQQMQPALYMSAPPDQQLTMHPNPAPYMSAPQYQQHMMHPNPAPHISIPQYQQQMQQHIHPAPYMSAPQYQQQTQQHMHPAPYMSAPQYQQYMQQRQVYSAPMQQRQQRSGVMSAQQYHQHIGTREDPIDLA